MCTDSVNLCWREWRLRRRGVGCVPGQVLSREKMIEKVRARCLCWCITGRIFLYSVCVRELFSLYSSLNNVLLRGGFFVRVAVRMLLMCTSILAEALSSAWLSNSRRHVEGGAHVLLDGKVFGAMPLINRARDSDNPRDCRGGWSGNKGWKGVRRGVEGARSEGSMMDRAAIRTRAKEEQRIEELQVVHQRPVLGRAGGVWSLTEEKVHL